MVHLSSATKAQKAGLLRHRLLDFCLCSVKFDAVTSVIALINGVSGPNLLLLVAHGDSSTHVGRQ